MDVVRSITPVLPLIVNPTVELYVPPVVKLATGVGAGLVPFAHTGVVYENPVTGVIIGLIVILVVLLPASVQPEAIIEYVTVYVPGVDDDNVITPVPGLIVNPDVELYVPPVVKLATGEGTGLVPLAQTGVVYENPVTGVMLELTTTLTVEVADQPAAVTVTV